MDSVGVKSNTAGDSQSTLNPVVAGNNGNKEPKVKEAEAKGNIPKTSESKTPPSRCLVDGSIGSVKPIKGDFDSASKQYVKSVINDIKNNKLFPVLKDGWRYVEDTSIPLTVTPIHVLDENGMSRVQCNLKYEIHDLAANVFEYDYKKSLEITQRLGMSTLKERTEIVHPLHPDNKPECIIS